MDPDYHSHARSLVSEVAETMSVITLDLCAHSVMQRE